METSTDFSNLLVDFFRIATGNTVDYTSWLYRKNDRHNIIIQKMVRAGLLDSNQHEKNDAVQQKHQQKSIYSSFIVN